MLITRAVAPGLTLNVLLPDNHASSTTKDPAAMVRPAVETMPVSCETSGVPPSDTVSVPAPSSVPAMLTPSTVTFVDRVALVVLGTHA